MARIELYKFKNLKKNNIFYSDTDSIFLSSKINNKLINNQIGNLTHIFKKKKIIESFFISVKLYGLLLLINNQKFIIIKAKGISKNILSFKFLKVIFFKFIKNCYFNKHFLRIQYKNIQINFTFIKRKKIYIKNFWINTKPLRIFK